MSQCGHCGGSGEVEVMPRSGKQTTKETCKKCNGSGKSR